MKNTNHCETDYVSVIQFASDSRIVVKNVPLDRAPDSVSQVSGGTVFYPAMIHAEQCIREDLVSKTPIIVFIPDGGSSDYPQAETVSKRLYTNYESRGIRIHTIAVGSDADPNSLRKIATEKGTFHSCANGMELVSTFQTIATGAKPSQAIFEDTAANITKELTTSWSLDYF